MALELFNSATDGSQGSRVTSLVDQANRSQLRGTADRITHLLEVTGNLDGGDANIQFSNDGVNFTTHATASPIGNAPINILGDFIQVDGSGLGASSALIITVK